MLYWKAAVLSVAGESSSAIACAKTFIAFASISSFVDSATWSSICVTVSAGKKLVMGFSSAQVSFCKQFHGVGNVLFASM